MSMTRLGSASPIHAHVNSPPKGYDSGCGLKRKGRVGHLAVPSKREGCDRSGGTQKRQGSDRTGQQVVSQASRGAAASMLL